jgi:CO/xanthine dehydrogenase Mo-binding subunit
MLLGRGRFTGDLARTGTLHAAFVRSPFAAAQVKAIDLSGALAMPEVRAAFTAAELGHPYLLAVLEREEFTATRMPLLAGDQVRFVGEPVAVVIADDPYVAEDAAEAVDVEWTPLQAIAVASALRDALGVPGSVGRLPLTPSRVRALAQSRPMTADDPKVHPVDPGLQSPAAAPEANAGGDPCDLPR